MMNKINKRTTLPKSTYLYWSGFSLVALVAAVLRFYHLTYESLWMDELRQVSYYSLPIKGVISGAASQNQPPLDYLIGWGLHHLGLAGSDWWVRFPAVIFGIGSILLLMWWCRRFINDFTALVAGALLSISPLYVRMSQEARPYTIFIFLALLSLTLFSYAWTKNRKSNWYIFSLIFFFLLTSRWIGPLIFAIGLSIYIIGAWFYKGDTNIPVKRSIISLLMPLSIYTPLFIYIYTKSTFFISKEGKTISAFFQQCRQMIGMSFRACFTSAWVIPLVIAGLVIIFLKIFSQKKMSNQKMVNLSLFLLTLTGFALLYPAVFVYKSKASPKPQYLLLLAPLGAVSLGVLISELKRIFTRFTKVGSSILCGLIILLISLPMLQTTFKELSTRQNRDWRQAGKIINQYDDSEKALFLSITNAFSKWSPPFYSIPRYIEKVGLHIGIRHLVRGDYDNKYQVGTIYAVVYKGFNGSHFPLPAPERAPQQIGVYDLHGLSLYRYPGTEETWKERLLRLLTYLGSEADKGIGLTELYLAKCRILTKLEDKEGDREAYLQAFKQCRNEEERLLFLKRVGSWQESLGVKIK